MLPQDLVGPCQSIDFPDGIEFLTRAFREYPELHPDFVRQACCEHPDRMNEFFPNFDILQHLVVERHFTAAWIKTHVRYDGGESLATGAFYGFHIDRHLNLRLSAPQICRFMLDNLTWPFPPIIVESAFASRELGSSVALGEPYHLFEGTHRMSYLLGLLEMNLVAPDSEHPVLVIENR